MGFRSGPGGSERNSLCGFYKEQWVGHVAHVGGVLTSLVSKPILSPSKSIIPEPRKFKREDKNSRAIPGYLDKFRGQEILFQSKGSVAVLSCHRTLSVWSRHREMPKRPL